MATIRKIDPEEAASLIAEIDAYVGNLYPAESNHLESVEQLKRKNVAMFGAYEGSEITAMGAVKCMDGYGEIKRIYVPTIHRGKGLAKAIMETLERHLISVGIHTSRLETGIHQHEALGLYRKGGYIECDPFGDYRPDPLSIFMEKKL